MARQLLVYFGTDMGQRFSLPDQGTVSIGRGREAPIRLNDLQVSRLHCRLQIGAGIVVHDSGSAGGTFVNGLRIAEHPLRIGDTLRVGETEMRLQEVDVTDQKTLVPADESPPAAIPLGRAASRTTPMPVAEILPLATPVPLVEILPVAPVVPLAEAVVAGVPVALPAETAFRAVPVAKPAFVSLGAPGTPLGLTGQTLAHYEVGPLLAQGHSGSVFRARDLQNGQEVALKVLWPHLAANPDVVQRLGRSSKIMLSIRHPNIVALYEAGQTGAYCWLAMEYIEGESLTQVIDRIGVAGMLDWRHAYRVAVHIGRALHTIHQQHIIHRNLAPQNVLLRAADKSAVLSDVVLAKALEGTAMEQITRPGEILGDVRYMAPEQVTAGDPVDARADLYCLGAMLYALLTGRPPLEGRSLPDTVNLIRNVEPARPKKFQMSIGDLFEGVVLKMLAKKPQARFQTAQELLQELERVGRFQGIQVP
jgi:hypothetical protein